VPKVINNLKQTFKKMSQRFQLFAAIAAIVATESLVAAGSRNLQRDKTRSKDPSEIGFFSSNLYKEQTAADKLA